MEQKILINAFADEASSIIDNQIIAMKRNNLNGLDAAIAMAKKLGPGKTVVTILPDTAERYFSTPLFDE